MVFVCSTISVVLFYTQGIFGCHILLFLSNLLSKLVGAGLSRVYCLFIRSSAVGFRLLHNFSGAVLHPRGLRVSHSSVYVESSSLTHHRSYS